MKWLSIMFSLSVRLSRSTLMIITSMTFLTHILPLRMFILLFCRKESLLPLNLPLSFYRWNYGVFLYEILTIDKLQISGELGFGFVYHNCQANSDWYTSLEKDEQRYRIDSLRWKHFCICRAFHFSGGGSPFPRMDGNKIPNFKRDTECINHNMWMTSCMLLSCCCVLFFFWWLISYGSSSSSICPAFINVLDKKCIFF